MAAVDRVLSDHSAKRQGDRPDRQVDHVLANAGDEMVEAAYSDGEPAPTMTRACVCDS